MAVITEQPQAGYWVAYSTLARGAASGSSAANATAALATFLTQNPGMYVPLRLVTDGGWLTYRSMATGWQFEGAIADPNGVFRTTLRPNGADILVKEF